MLRPLRRRLRLIRYYSASREETIWTRSADAALFLTLGLALPMVLLCDAIVVRPTVAMEHPGALDRANNGRITARLAEPEGSPVWSRNTFGYFTLLIVEEVRGWPMATSTQTRPVRIEYDLFHEAQKRLDYGSADDEPLREAIGEALASSNLASWPQSWQRDSPTRASKPILRWFLGVGLWWIILYIGAMFALASLRLAALIWQRRAAIRARRLARTGRCAYCGYDLRGTEFSERCPECGELAG